MKSSDPNLHFYSSFVFEGLFVGGKKVSNVKLNLERLFSEIKIYIFLDNDPVKL